MKGSELNLLALADFIAQTTAPAAGATSQPGSQGTPPGPLMQFLSSGMMPILLAVVVLYIFMFRSKGKEKKQREDMLANLKKGDEVQTIGGEFGKVLDVRPDRVQVKVDESSNTKIWYSRSAIHRVVTEEKAEAK